MFIVMFAIKYLINFSHQGKGANSEENGGGVLPHSIRLFFLFSQYVLPFTPFYSCYAGPINFLDLHRPDAWFIIINFSV